MRPSFPESGSEADFRQDVLSRLGKLERGSRGAISGDGSDTFLRSGNFIVAGGDIQVLDNGDIIIDGGELRAVSGATTRALLDRDRLRLNRADGTRSIEVTPGGGLRAYAENGTTRLVTLDGNGLDVIGGMVTPLWLNQFGDNTSNATLTTTHTVINSVTITPPSWVQTLHLWMSHFIQMTDADRVATSRLNIGDGPFSAITMRVGGTSNIGVASRTDTATKTSASFPITVNQECGVASGTNSTNLTNVVVLAVGVRN